MATYYYAKENLTLDGDQEFVPGEKLPLQEDHPHLSELLLRQLVTDRAPRRSDNVRRRANADKE